MSQAGIRPRNHPKQVRTRQSDLFHESGGLDSVDDRRTPRDLFDRLHSEFHFTMDAAASAENHLLPRYCDKFHDGLYASWANERVWCNPPYSALPDWVEKAWSETEVRCPLVVMLLPADRTEQPWWHEFVEPHRDRDGSRVTTRFIRKRVKFALPPEHPYADKGLANGKRGGGYRSPPFGCVLVIFDGRSG